MSRLEHPILVAFLVVSLQTNLKATTSKTCPRGLPALDAPLVRALEHIAWRNEPVGTGGDGHWKVISLQIDVEPKMHGLLVGEYIMMSCDKSGHNILLVLYSKEFVHLRLSI